MVTIVTTAAELLTLLRPFSPTVEDGALVFDLDLPAELLPPLRVLHTGIRAALTGRQWWGSADAGAKRPHVAVLSVHDLIPDWCGLLCVEGDPRWDRIRPAARIDLPSLFAPKER